MKTQRQNSLLFSAWLQRIGANNHRKSTAPKPRRSDAEANSEGPTRFILKPLKVTSEETRDLVVLKVAGREEYGSIPVLERELSLLTQQGKHRVVLDCSDLGYLSGLGMRLLIDFQNRTHERGGELNWVGLRKDFLSIVQVLQGDHGQHCSQNREEAVAAFQRVT